jgi:hypothetical protein
VPAKYLDAGFLPIPSTGKQPVHKHKGGVWKRDNCRQKLHLFNKAECIGLLLDEEGALFVLDFDTKASYEKLSAEFQEDFANCPLQKTRKGCHAFFARTPLLNKRGITDTARGLVDLKTGATLDIDMKTITASVENGVHTAGFLAVFPSPGKTWERSILTTKVAPISDELVNWLTARRKKEPDNAKKRKASANKKTGKKAKAAGGAAAAAAAANEVYIIEVF